MNWNVNKSNAWHGSFEYGLSQWEMMLQCNQNDPYIVASTFGTETHNIAIARIPCPAVILGWQVTGTQHSTIWGLKRLLYDNGMTMTMVGQMKRQFYLENAIGCGYIQVDGFVI